MTSVLPLVLQIDTAMIAANFGKVKNEVQQIIETEVERVMNDPALVYLVVRKND